MSQEPLVPPENLEDLRLAQGAARGVSGDVERMAERLQRVPAFLSAINRRRGSPLSAHDLEDLGQDAIIRIFQKLSAFHGRGTLDNWLYRFCLLEFMNRLRKHARGPKQEALATDPRVDGGDDQGALDDFARFLDRLPDHESIVVELKHFEDLKFEEIARRLGIPKGTVKSRYYSALTRLRTYLRGDRPEEGPA